jgi:alkylated DNA repair dioxygenase AlkB
MSVAVQESLLDMGGEPVVGALGRAVRRRALAHGAGVDVRPGWLGGSGVVFGRLLETVPWRAEKRQMYDKVVDVPRLLCFYGEGAPLPDPVLAEALRALNAHYGAELGEPFLTAGLCLYRDGRDSVAWHGDTIGRGRHEDTMVAILSLGAPRALALRPRHGGAAPRSGRAAPRSGRAALRYELGHGDLLVMGGSCQRTWEHAVPKTSQAAGPRISVQFRPRGVR